MQAPDDMAQGVLRSSAMDLTELRDLVAPGSVTEHGVRLWFRSERPGPLRLYVWPAEAARPELGFPIQFTWEAARDGTGACVYPDDFPNAPALEPGHRFRFRIARESTTRGEEVLGDGCFETAPSAERTPFAFALMSCHQPLREDGSMTGRAAAMLAALGPALEQHGAKYLLLLGDQIYADAPGRRSLFAPGGPLSGFPKRWPPAPQIRAAYQRRYRQAWSTPMGALLAQRASYLVLDDHDVFDAWGSLPEHQTEPWLAARAGALAAAFDYQLGRNLPEARRAGPYWRWFRWGNTATFLGDDRSERQARDTRPGRMMSEAQLGGLEAFLDQHRDCGALFVAFSVPLVFLPDWFTRAGVALTGSHPGAVDRFSFEDWRVYRSRVLELLIRQRQRCQSQQLVLLSGDVHESLAVTLRPKGAKLPIYQLVSSPVTNTQRGWMQWLAHTASRLTRRIDVPSGPLPVELLPGVGDARHNPYADLNVAVVEVDAAPARVTLRFKVLAPTPDGGALRVVFDSGAL